MANRFTRNPLIRKLMLIGMMAGSVLGAKAETKPHHTLPKLDIEHEITAPARNDLETVKTDTSLLMAEKENRNDVTVTSKDNSVFPDTKKKISRSKTSLYIVLGSRHTEGTLSHAETINRYGYNEKNPGLLGRRAFGQRKHSEWAVIGGVLTNSIRDKYSPFLMAGRDWFVLNDHFQFGLYAGAGGYGKMVERRVMDKKTGTNKIEAHSEGPMNAKYLAFLHAQINLTRDVGITLQGLAYPGKGSLVTYGIAIGSGIFKKHSASSTNGRGSQQGYYSQTKDEILRNKIPDNPVKSIMYNNADSTRTGNARFATGISLTL